ncbi:sec-independent translocase [Streptomyces sp. BPTC-684]|uniref:sec-independent translocase n=1 Tax=Streptomyces sp. BPTC-684 TaxID=3043734 RepID=UPI0024B06FE1|nr:sec-independent translocase [Streptomyces sp. BPTC-684]WHM36768.1 sec-independent translocase [Streptomyces sp. BPTC-684]
MFNDIGPMELVTLVVLAVLIFGPDKLPKLIQDVSGFIRKIRSFSETAKADIRAELGPEFKDFEFEDLNPKTFVRKQLMDNDDLGLKEIRNSFDLRKDMEEVADAVHGRESAPAGSAGSTTAANGSAAGVSGTPDLLKKRDKLDPGERPPYDADAT